MERFKVVIIDDERLAREEVKRHLLKYDSFDIVGEAGDAKEGRSVVEATKPHLIFLDIEMPEKSGFDLLDELTTVPEIVFTTAYSEYASKAFDVEALDYLVKPIREERFAKSISRVKKELSKSSVSQPGFTMNQKIFIKEGDKCFYFPIKDVRYIESLENYARLHFTEGKAMLKKSLNSIEKKLDPSVFFRINRSQIINTNFVKEIRPGFKGRLRLVLETGETFEVSSRQSMRFKNWNSL